MYQASSYRLKHDVLKPEAGNEEAACRLVDSRPRKRRSGLCGRRRRGIAALWVILVTPAFLLLLCFVADIGKLWLARVELENGLEAAALAGASVWGKAGGGTTTTARAHASSYAYANTVDGQSLQITSNFESSNVPNQNALPTGNLLFGTATPAGTAWIFNASVAPDCNLGHPYAVRAQGKAAVSSFCNGFLGIAIGPYSVSSETTAIYDCSMLQPKIVASP